LPTDSLIMSAPKLETSDAEHHEVPVMNEKEASGRVVQVQAASVALAAAIAAQKPSLLSKNMIKLYFIMAVGYLVSTMNGFGSYCIFKSRHTSSLTHTQIPPSWDPSML
jgi:hypothetical protein